jgi:hypothetical protein
MRGTSGKQDTLGHSLLQVPLERASWHIWRDGLQCLQVSFRVFHEVNHQSLLPCVEIMLHSYYIGFDDPPAPLGDLIHLRG